MTLRWLEERRALQVQGRGVSLLVPGTDLAVRSGGWRGDAVHLIWMEEAARGGAAEAVTLEDADDIDALAQALPAGPAEALREHRARLRRRRRRNRLALGTLCALLALPVALFLWVVADPDPLLDLAVARLPTSVDVALAERVEASLLARGTVEDPVLQGAVEAIGQRLLAAAPPHPYDFRFHVIPDASINAFAAPGGVVAVHAGLLAAAASPQEVAGVLAHEIAHVLERHSLRQLLYQLGLWAGVQAILGRTEALSGPLAGLGSELARLGFGRDQEREADRVGFDLLVAAGIPPSGLVEFFERLEESGPDVPLLLSSHPGSGERAADVRARVAELKDVRWRPFELDWAAVQQRATR